MSKQSFLYIFALNKKKFSNNSKKRFMTKELRIALQILCVIGAVSELFTTVFGCIGIFNPNNINFIPMEIGDAINCFLFAVIYVFIGMLFKLKTQNRMFFFLLAFLNICFLALNTVITDPMAYKIGNIFASFSNFIIEFYVGLNLLKLIENKYIKGLGLSLLINAIIWFFLLAFLYSKLVANIPALNYITMTLSVLDQVSCLYIMLTAFFVFKFSYIPFNSIE